MFGAGCALESEKAEGPSRNWGLRRSRTWMPTIVDNCSALEKRLEIVEKLRLTLCSHDAGGLLTVLKHDHGGNAHDAEATCNIGIVVHVEFGDSQAAGLLFSDLFKDGGDHLAGATPFGPEVDDNGDGR